MKKCGKKRQREDHPQNSLEDYNTENDLLNHTESFRKCLGSPIDIRRYGRVETSSCHSTFHVSFQ